MDAVEADGQELFASARDHAEAELEQLGREKEELSAMKTADGVQAAQEAIEAMRQVLRELDRA